MDVKEGREFKTVSTVLILMGILAVFLIYKNNNLTFNVFTWRDFFVCQIVAFIGLIPMDIFYYRKIKHLDQEKTN